MKSEVKKISIVPILDLVLLLIDEIMKYLEIAGNIGLCNI